MSGEKPRNTTRRCLFFWLSVAIGGCWALSAGCSKQPPSANSSPTDLAQVTMKPAAAQSTGVGETRAVNTESDLSLPLFDEVPPDESGVRFVHRLLPDHSLAYLYHSGYTCGGVCLGDVNDDGLCDIFLVSGPDENRLFLNQGGFAFEESLASITLSGGESWGVGASMADVDGDGDLDILVCNYESTNCLYRNEGVDAHGQLRFTECAIDAGLSYAGPSQFPYFADFDGDSDLDLFLLTNRIYAPFGRPREVASELGPDGQPQVKEKYARYFRVVRPDIEAPAVGDKTPPPPFLLEYGHADRLYRNDGVGRDGVTRFQDVTRDSGLDQIPGHGLSALIWDVNRDGRSDIYVANDYTDPDRLWLNRGTNEDGVMQFEDATDEFLPYTTWSSMGSDVADVDGDGRLDFMVADMAATTHFKAKSTMGEMSGWRRWVMENGWPRQTMRNLLFVDAGVDRFLETGFLAGVARSDWTWAVRFADFDLDGRNDLFLTNGSARVFTDSDIIVKPTMLIGRTEWEIFRDQPEMPERNLAFHNSGRWQFQDVSRQWNLDKQGMSYGAATGDLDGDGDLDLVVCNLNDNVSIYRNRATDSGAHWLKVRLEGAQANRFGFGAIVTVKLADGSSLVRLMNPQTGFLSASEPILHFGLGSSESVTDLIVQWPEGTVQHLGPQRVDQLIAARQSAVAEPVPEHHPSSTHLVEVAETIGIQFQHEEKPFDDYQREFLLPGKLSQFGPGVAVADVNADGLDDVFVGGAAGQAGTLFVQSPDHTFQPVKDAPWVAHADSEDMGLLFLDADRDSDLDLYVVHGSNEWNANDELYADRLYLNRTTAGDAVDFVESESGSIPDLRSSGSCVVGADYDQDGDVDLFVGARSIPGKYPLEPQSTLLRNDGLRAGEVLFTDVTDATAPFLREAGLVTGAIWSDVDGDRWLDLLVSSEWGPVRLYLNRQGRFDDCTKTAGLGDRYGWWNSIAAADFDGDGDMDYVTLNVGLNTKYGRPSGKKPAILYRGDMDENGVFDLVEAKASNGGELPVRGRSCSCNAMPQLRERFPTYKGFASASLDAIYTNVRLDSATKTTATEFESGIWINESTPGNPSFSWQALPIEVQIAPGYGAVAADFFGDSAPSLVCLQNLLTREPETGPWSGGLGCVLRPSAADGTLTPVGHDASGFVVPGDGKALAVADLNHDGRPDLVASQNNDALLTFVNRTDSGTRPICVRLIGPPGNPQGIGARLTLVENGKAIATVEIQAGSGYLSQSAAAAFFVAPESDMDREIHVRWPEGTESNVAIVPGQSIIRVPIHGLSLDL